MAQEVCGVDGNTAEAREASVTSSDKRGEQATLEHKGDIDSNSDCSIREDDFGADDDHFSEVGAASETEVTTLYNQLCCPC